MKPLSRRTNFVFALLLLLAALLLLARALGILPEGMYDLALRAAPALLVLLGLSLLLRGYVRFDNGIALLVSIGLVGALTAFSFSTRSTQQRDDYRVSIDQQITAEVSTLQIDLETLATDVELTVAAAETRTVTGEFVGSTESLVHIEYLPAGGVATLRVIETSPNTFPMLAAIGRGHLRLEVPPGIALAIAFAGQQGAAAFNLNGSSLERLNIDLRSGDVLVALPEYRPLLSNPGDLLGTLSVRSGSLTLVVPAEVAGRFELDRGGSGIRPEFDANIYNYLDGDILEARDIDTAAMVMRYALTVPRGAVRLQSPR